MKKILYSITLFIVLSGFCFAEVQNVKVSGELRNRGLYSTNVIDLSDNSKPDDDIGYFAQRARINVEADLTDNVLTVIELEASGIVGDKGVAQNANSVAAAQLAGLDSSARSVRNADGTTDIQGSVHMDENTTAQGRRQKDGYDVKVSQAYVQASELFYTPLTGKIGRQYMNFGKGFLISDNEHEINFDAIRSTLDFYPIIVDAVYARLAERSSQAIQAVDADDMSMYVVNAHYAADRWNAEAYVIGLVDVDTHYQPVTVGLRGDVMPMEALQLWVEGDYQGNQYTPNRDLEAWAANVGATYTFDFKWHPALSVIYTVASGEENPTATTGDYEGFQELFEYNYYGYAFSPRLENIQFINAKVSVLPMDNVTLGFDYYHYWQLEQAIQSMGDPFQDNGGVAALTTGNDESLGDEFDLMAAYDYTEDVSTQLYLAWFLPGSAYTPDDTAFEIRGEILVSF
ncbi:MAG: alginate export family protein [Chlamydiae bacterium]|nr:alginate export family protein [Chlamydiota bacterium]MBI3276811.1 alginate export family protein [Chlamydiota bacterium]